MSRTKTVTENEDSENLDTVVETETQTENKAEETTETTAVEETKKESLQVEKVVEEKKMNLLQFLEQKKLSIYVIELMKKNFKMEFHTMSEWESILEKLLK